MHWGCKKQKGFIVFFISSACLLHTLCFLVGCIVVVFKIPQYSRIFNKFTCSTTQSYKVTVSEETLSEKMDQKGEKRCSIDEVNFFDSVEETNCTCPGCQIRCPLDCPLVLYVVLLSVENMAQVVVDYLLFVYFRWMDNSNCGSFLSKGFLFMVVPNIACRCKSTKVLVDG